MGLIEGILAGSLKGRDPARLIIGGDKRGRHRFGRGRGGASDVVLRGRGRGHVMGHVGSHGVTWCQSTP